MKTIHISWILILTVAFGWRSEAQTKRPVGYDMEMYSPSLKVWTNAASLFKLGTNFWSNSGEDHSLGAKLMLELGNAGYVPAEMWLGQTYEQDMDPEGKLGLMMEAGTLHGIYYCKILTLSNQNVTRYEGVSPFIEKSAGWYQKAAEQGDVDAQYKLGSFYLGREGLLDYKEALKWGSFAAARGDKRAKLMIARLYAEGLGTPKDVPKAIQLYAECEAFYKISRIYLMNSNHIAAYTWWYVGNAHEKQGDAPPFTSDYANITFSAAERATGASYATAYMAGRYINTNSVPDHRN